jgi:hypothetical protein
VPRSIPSDYLGGVDRDSIARSERRRQALEALEFERSREAALRERVEAIVVELDGAAVDAAAFERMRPEDVDVVRAALQAEEPPPGDEAEGEAEEKAAWLEEELTRLGDEIAGCGRRQQAFERYLDALDRRG